jgi:hypothetical protein
MQARVLDALARERGVVIGEERLERRLAQLTEELRQSGQRLEDLLDAQDLGRAEFREYLRLAMVQETLTRRALGLRDDAPLTGEQQELWLSTELAQRGVEELPPPWAPGAAVARSGDVVVRREEYVEHLRRQLDRSTLRTACFQLLLAERMRARMPDLAPETLDEALAAEIERRRAESDADPAHKGVTYEVLLRSQGLSIERLEDDPVIAIATLSRLWIERSYDEPTLKRVYADEREWFDGQFGEAWQVAVLFLRAAHLPNELVPRSFDEADAELARIARGLTDRAAFARAVRAKSEDPSTREEDGALGWVTRGDERAPEALRAAVFERAPALLPEGGAIGPLRVSGGCLVAWVGARRPAPSWDAMSRHVRGVLRQRFIDDVLEEADVVTWMDLD